MPVSLMTIERHILERQREFPSATGDFTNLMYDIALAAKMISRETTRAGLAEILGTAGTTNSQGEEQQLLDVYANRTLVRLLDHTGRLCVMGSEEDPHPIMIPAQYSRGNYVLLFDPLDGSTNIDYNVSIGTIFSIYRRVSENPDDCGLPDLLQPGWKQIAAGYTVYGSSTMLVYAAGNGVHGFTLDPSVGEFLLSHENIRIPEKPKYYSVNEGYSQYWHEGIRRYVQWLKGLDPDYPTKGLGQRYIGSLVADFHRNLLAGGIFLYPADTRDPGKTHGKLRLCYECNPLAFIAEQAGGRASDGIDPILNIQPTELHQRTPLFIGSKDLVDRLEEYIQRYDQDWIEAYRDSRTVSQPQTA